MINKIMYTFCLLFSLAGCINDDLFTNKAGSDYFPNRIGNYWEYSVIDSIGNISSEKYTVSITITGLKVMADGKGAYVWEYRYPSGIDTSYVRVENDTVKIFSPGYTSIRALKFPRQIFQIPFIDRQKWNGKLMVEDSYTVSKNSDGFLISYYNLGPDTELNYKLLFKPNIGFTSMNKFEYTGGPISHRVWQLLRYSLK